MEHAGRLTSEEMAAQGGTNPVVMRRTMAGLRAAGIVRSEKGHGGGWSLARSLDEVTLHHVYQALGEPTILAMGTRTESPGCAVERAVNGALGGAFAAAEEILVEELRRITLAALAKNIGPNLRHHRSKHASPV
jgi:DNA-binding IscR family transcriptional regulator